MNEKTQELLTTLAAEGEMTIEELAEFTKEERRDNALCSLGILPQRWLTYQWNIENREDAAKDEQLLKIQDEFALTIKQNSLGLALFGELRNGMYAIDVAEMHAWLFAYAMASGVDNRGDTKTREEWEKDLKASFNKSTSGKALYTLVNRLTVGISDEDKVTVNDYGRQRVKGHNQLATVVRTKVLDYIHDTRRACTERFPKDYEEAALTLLSMVMLNKEFERTFMMMVAAFANYTLGAGVTGGKEMPETVEFADRLVTEMLERGQELYEEMQKSPE